MSCSEILIHFQPFLSCLFQRNFQKFEDKVTYMLRRNSLAIYVRRRHKSKLNSYGNRSYLDFGFAGEATPPHCFHIMNAFNMLRKHRQKSSVTLSGFWPLRGWGIWVIPLKKGNSCRKSFFQLMLNEALNIFEKWYLLMQKLMKATRNKKSRGCISYKCL